MVFTVAGGPKTILLTVGGLVSGSSAAIDGLTTKLNVGVDTLLRYQPYPVTETQNEDHDSATNDQTTGIGLATSALIGSVGTKIGKDHVSGGAVPKGPNLTIRDYYVHHKAMVDDLKAQLTAKGYRVSEKEISFGHGCEIGRCRPDIVYKKPDGKTEIIEVKTGDAALSIRQTEIFLQIRNGDSIPRGEVARDFGLIPNVPLKDQGYPDGIPIKETVFTGAVK